MKVLLSIAGYDPSSGAGVLLDIAVFHRLGFCGMGALTSVTIQNTTRVESFRTLPGRFILGQYKTLAKEVSFSGIKVGMLGSGKNIPALDLILKKHRDIPIVVDPVFRSSSGCWLLEREAVPSYVARLRDKISVLTPNLEESSIILGRRVQSLEEMKEAALRIGDLIDAACLVKGGHLKKKVSDVLYDGRRIQVIANPKIPKTVHGTGCFLSSSLLCFLAEGHSVAKACELAVGQTRQAIQRAVPSGKGGFIFPPQF
ncbi:MAG: hydroxymethylpyrimidine/phosphomethylpyrimidine kinase [Acidobacteriota bacterium]